MHFHKFFKIFNIIFYKTSRTSDKDEDIRAIKFIKANILVQFIKEL